MTDIFINFRTSYVEEKTNKEILNSRAIAIHYLKGKFWIDLLASIPFDYIALAFTAVQSGSLVFNLISLLKLARVLRLSRLITHLNIRNELKISLKLAKLIFFLVLYLHCVGCIWFYIVKKDENWVPPIDYMFGRTEVFLEDSFYQY